uniref:Uncharacterized protein n=1 Tax=Megaselia scalaris TaxID=36166 RepID=T1GFC5_MEGSC
MDNDFKMCTWNIYSDICFGMYSRKNLGIIYVSQIFNNNENHISSDSELLIIAYVAYLLHKIYDTDSTIYMVITSPPSSSLNGSFIT